MSPSTTRIFATCVLLAGTFRAEEPLWMNLIRYLFVVVSVIAIRCATVVEESRRKTSYSIYNQEGLKRWREVSETEEESK